MSWLKFADINSDSMNIIVSEYPDIVRAEERVESVVVPGRQGDLTLTTGRAVYQAYVKECKCLLLPVANVAAIANWLKGAGDLVMGNEPLYTYDARIIHSIPFERIQRGREHRSFVIPFYVQPLKRLTSPDGDIVLTSSGSSINNPGHVESRPLIAVKGSGTIRIMIGTDSITMITGLEGTILLDSDIGIATDDQRVTNMSPMVSGDWPVIAPGNTTISWTGDVTSVTITPRWRWL